MKNKNLMFGMILMAVFIMIIPSNASASIYSGAWQPVTNSVLTVQFATGTPGSASGNDFYLYDWGNITNDLFILTDGPGPLYPTVSIAFSQDTSLNWLASANAVTINLGPTSDFGFYFDNGGPTPLISYGLNHRTDLQNNPYEIESNRSEAAMGIFVYNASPVPIPSALLLFGSGLFGVIGFRRHRRLNQ